MYVQQVNTWSCIKEWKKRNFFLNTRIYLFLCFYQVNERKLIREITSIFIKWLYSFNHFYFLSPFHKKTTRNVEEMKKKIKSADHIVVESQSTFKKWLLNWNEMWKSKMKSSAKIYIWKTFNIMLLFSLLEIRSRCLTYYIVVEGLFFNDECSDLW